jgi:hypothetical protein
MFSNRFIISVGDNFYPKGVKSVDDPQWKTTFEDVYSAPSLKCRWYIVGGNHDEYSNISAQIAYTIKSPRWFFPNYYYRETIFETPDPAKQPLLQVSHIQHPSPKHNKSTPLLDMIFLDSAMLLNGTRL